jgi:hypothetical protein
MRILSILGRTAITRLIHVSKYGSSNDIRLKALLIAIRRVKADTLDYELYGNLVDELTSWRKSQQGTSETSPESLGGFEFDGEFDDLRREISGKLDDDWLSLTSQRVKKEADKLEAEMRNYSVNLIKESIRVRCVRPIKSCTALTPDCIISSHTTHKPSTRGHTGTWKQLSSRTRRLETSIRARSMILTVASASLK